MTILTIGLALVLGSILMFAVRLSSITAVRGQVNTYGAWLAILRLAFIAGVALMWGPVVRRLHAGNRIYQIRMHELLALRWRVTAWLLILELLIGQDLLPRLIAAFSGTAS
ncbi:MAG: hypothetical protein WD795_08370 [Woeseia sp.]